MTSDEFARWLAACEEPLRLSLRRFARQVDVEGMLQETALRAWHAAPRIEPQGGPDGLLRWAKTVAKNLAIDQVRKNRHEVVLEDDVPAPLSPPPDPALRRRIGECLAGLPPKLREALMARIEAAGTLSDRLIADSARMKFDAFRQNLARGRRLLEKCLRKFGIDVRRLLE